MFHRILEEFKRSINGGMIHIFGSSVLAQVGSLISSVIVIRRLPKVAYGYYVSANNIYSYISVFVGMGLFASILQFCSEKVSEERKRSIYHFAFSVGNVFNIILAFMILFAGIIWKRLLGDSQSGLYLSYMAGIPFVVYINSYYQTVFRVRQNNKGFAYTNIIFTITSLISHIIFTFMWGTVGLIISTYFANLSAAFFAYIVLKKNGFFRYLRNDSIDLNKKDKKNILSFSLLCSITNFTSALLVLLDVTCLNFVLKDPEILSDYKVASVIPAACIFIPTCLITYYYPVLVEKISESRDRFKSYLIKLVKLFFAVAILVFLFLVLLSPQIIMVFYGEKYLNVVHLFRILSINFLISAVRKLLGNAIVIIKKVHVNLIHTTIAGLMNIALNLILIRKYASVGAAYATVIVSSFIVCLEVIYLIRHLNMNEKELKKSVKPMRRVLLLGYSQIKHIRTLFERIGIECYEISFDSNILKRKITNICRIVIADTIYLVGGEDVDQGGIVLKIAAKLKKTIVVHWIGTDVLHIIKDYMKYPREINKNCINLAGSEALSHELSQIGIRSKWIPIVPCDIHFKPLPAPLTHAVLAYIPEEKEDFYNMQMLKDIANYFPEIEFHIVANNGRNDKTPLKNIIYEGTVDACRMRELYSECSVLFRYPKHDGLSMMVIEALGTGRAVIYKYPFPYCINPDTDHIEDLLTCFKNIFEKKPIVQEKAVNYVNSIFSEENQVNRYKECGLL